MTSLTVCIPSPLFLDELTQTEHFLSLHRDMRERGQLAVAFPANAERQAQTDDLEIWRRMIEEEQERRLIKVAMAMNHKPS